MICGGCDSPLSDFFTSYAWVTLNDSSRSDVSKDIVVAFCTPHCMFDWVRKHYREDWESMQGADKGDLLIAVGHDLLAALDGFSDDATDEQWQALNDAHERLGILLGQYAAPTDRGVPEPR